MNIRILTTGIIIGFLMSCSKDEEASVQKEPIAFLQPSTNPASISKGTSIKYDIRLTNDEYIDSVMIFYQIDSLGIGYKDSTGTTPNYNPLDSLIRKEIYLSGNRNNEKSIDGAFIPHKFPAVGKKIYLVVKMRSKSRNPDKRLPLIVN